jgi:hypothetical protein
MHLQIRICSRLGRSGGAGVRILFITATLILFSAVIFYFLDGRQKYQETLDRKAVETSEYGLFAALQRLKDNPSWDEGIPKTPYGDGWYSVGMVRRSIHDTTFLDIVSTGRAGQVLRMRECVLKLAVSGDDSVWVGSDIR